VDLYSYSSCLTISNAGVTDARHHVQLRHFWETNELSRAYLFLTTFLHLFICAYIVWAISPSAPHTPSTSIPTCFLPFSIPPVHILPLVCDPYPVILLNLFLVYNLHMRKNIRFFAWLTLLKMMFSSSIHLLANDKISFLVAEQNSIVSLHFLVNIIIYGIICSKVVLTELT
jgi:hypothetical protein